MQTISNKDIENMKKLKYKVQPYPKGESKRYDSGTKISTQQILI